MRVRGRMREREVEGGVLLSYLLTVLLTALLAALLTALVAALLTTLPGSEFDNVVDVDFLDCKNGAA